MESVYLEFQEGSSDKFYRIVAVSDSGGQWITTVWWGRRGSAGQTQLKYIGPSEYAAKSCMIDLANKKRAKGYRDALDPLGPAAKTATPAKPANWPVSPALPPVPSSVTPGVPRFPAMKAREIEVDWLDLENYAMEEKFDGHRAGLTFNPDGTIVIRNVYGDDKGKIENAPHIASIMEGLAFSYPSLRDGTLIDGELVGLTLQETTHLLGPSGKSDPRLRFVAFDLPFLEGDDLREQPWITRRQALGKLLQGLPPAVELAEVYPPSYGRVEQIWARGGEGAILKPITSWYVPGGRYDWIKVKEHHTAEAIITGWAPGAGKYSNQIGALKLSQYRNGVLTEITKVSGMTDQTRKSMTTNWPAWNGSVIEFEYQCKTPDSYRHPRYVRTRPDKDPADCTWESSPG